MILEPPASVQKLRTALQVKAKEKSDYRFYLLYDKVYRKDVLAYAYQRCKANNGAPGIDGQDFADVEAYGEERWLDELAETLRRKTYRPEAVRRVDSTENGRRHRANRLIVDPMGDLCGLIWCAIAGLFRYSGRGRHCKLRQTWAAPRDMHRCRGHPI